MIKKRICSTLLATMLAMQAVGVMPVSAATSPKGQTFASFAAAVQQTVRGDAGKAFYQTLVYDAAAGTLTPDDGDAVTAYGGLSVGETGLLLHGATGSGYGVAAMIPFETVAEEYGYTVISRGEQQVITNDFQTARLIVKAKGRIADYGAVSVVEGWNDLHILQYADSAAAYAAYQKYERDNAVQYVQPSRRIQLDAEKTPAEKEYNTWGAEAIGVKEFTEEYLNAEVLPEVIVAVIDTGINAAHSLFEGRILPAGINISDSGDDTVNDDLGHGTHCTGTVVELTPRNVKILPVKVFDSEGSASDEQIYLGMMYALEQGADILSMSFGGLGVSPLEIEAMAIADEANIICCAAAGNNGDDAGYYYPGGIASCITVGAVDETYERAGFSNNGALVDVMAPGVGILSGWIGEGDAMEVKNGTSMATPHVSACCALLRSYDKSITPRRAEALLRLNAIDLGEAGFDDETAWGMVCMKDFDWREGVCYAPEFSKESGNFGVPQTVEITTQSEDAQIYYTTDGTIPTKETGILYTAPVAINETMRVIAIATKEGYADSVPTEAAYSIGGADANNALGVKDGVLQYYRGIRTRLTIPAQVDGMTITAVAENAFAGNRYLEQVVLPDTVTILGDGAFSDCQKLTMVKAAGAVNLGDAVFSGDTALQTLTIGEKLESLGEGVFAGCESLLRLTIAGVSQIPARTFAGCKQLDTVEIPDAREIGDNAFLNCKKLVQVGCDWSRITKIGVNGMAGCPMWSGNLALSSLESLGEAAFSGDASLVRISLSENITELPEAVFAGCSGLYLLQLPGVTKIGGSALAVGSCRSTLITELDYEKITSVSTNGFYGFRLGNGYDTIRFSSLERLDFRTFAGVVAGAIDFPKVTTIPRGAFADSQIGLLHLEQVERIDETGLYGSNSAVLSKKLVKLAENGMPEGYWVVTLDEIPVLPEEIQLCDEPLVLGYTPQNQTVTQRNITPMQVLAGGVDMEYQWYRVEGEQQIPLSGETGDICYADTGRIGTTNYRCVMTDRGGKTEQLAFTITVKEASVSAGLEAETAQYFSGMKKEQLMIQVPAAGKWRICTEGAVPTKGTLCDENGKPIAQMEAQRDGYSMLDMVLQPETTYYLSIAGIWDGAYRLVLTQQPEARVSIADCVVSTAETGTPTYGTTYQPAVTIRTAAGKLLAEGKDYVLRLAQHNQSCEISIYGMGQYGGYTSASVMVYPVIPEAVMVPVSLRNASETAVYQFVPKTSGTYYYSASIVAGYREEQEAYYKTGGYAGGARYVGLRTKCVVASAPDGSGIVYGESNYSPVMGSYFSDHLELVAGQSYYFICSAATAAEYALILTKERRDMRKATIQGNFVATYENGTRKIPKLQVTWGGKTLVEGVDYQQINQYNDVPGNASVLVVGMGEYTGKQEKKYLINFYEYIEEHNTLTIDEPMQLTCGNEERVETLWFQADTAASGKQQVRYRLLNRRVSGGRLMYRLYRFNERTESYALIEPMAGTENDYMLINGTYCLACFRQYENLNGTAEFTLIRPFDLDHATLTIGEADYTGSEEAVPLVVTTEDGIELEPETDYTISYPDGHAMFGETRFTIRATDRSFGEQSDVFQIQVRLPEDAPFLETGEHAVTVTLDERLAIYRLTADADTDYILGSSDVPNIVLRCFTPDGEMEAQAFGKGSKSISFTVPAGETRYLMVKFNGTEREGTIHFLLETSMRLLSECEVVTEPHIWTGERITPVVAFYDGDYQLQEGIDYALRYTVDDVNIGTATANYVGMGTYFGLCDVTYHIVAENLLEMEDLQPYAVALNQTYAAEGEPDEPYLVLRYTAGIDVDLRATFLNVMCKLTVQRYDDTGHFVDSICIKPSGEMNFQLPAGETCYFLFSATDISGWNQTFQFSMIDRTKGYTQVKDDESGVVYRVNEALGYAELYGFEEKCKQIRLQPTIGETGLVPYMPEGLFVNIPDDAVVYGYSGCAAGIYADQYHFTYIEADISSEKAVYGDLNGDGRCSQADLVLLLRILQEQVALTLTQAQISAADINQDGLLDIMDYVALRQNIH